MNELLKSYPLGFLLPSAISTVDTLNDSKLIIDQSLETYRVGRAASKVFNWSHIYFYTQISQRKSILTWRYFGDKMGSEILPPLARDESTRHFSNNCVLEGLAPSEIRRASRYFPRQRADGNAGMCGSTPFRILISNHQWRWSWQNPLRIATIGHKNKYIFATLLS